METFSTYFYAVKYLCNIFFKGQQPIANLRLGGKTRYLTYYTQFCCEKGPTQDLNSPKPTQGYLKVDPLLQLQGMCCGMFCLDGEVLFIHSKHEKKIGSSTLILFVTCGYQKDALLC